MPTLDWLTRDEDLKRAATVPYRLLEADPALSHGDPASGNMLIQGDNLDALKSLQPYYRGQVKCIYIDPPYNTRSAFEHYDDNLEHSQWLAMIYPRLELLRNLLAEDGSIWVNIEDREGAYLKVILDECFGRSNFVQTLVWSRKVSPANDARFFSNDHDYIHVHAKRIERLSINRLPRSAENDAHYTNPDRDPRGQWNSLTMTGNKNRRERPNLYYSLTNPTTGDAVFPPDNLTWRYSQERAEQMNREGRIYWGRDGRSRSPRAKQYLKDAKPVVPRSIWHYGDVGHTQESMLEANRLFDVPFGTPKPERLIQRIIHIATKPGDLVLDSFLGSGTTAAVAHKMGRRWIGVEMGDHAVTHCVPRLGKVIEGEQGGISESVGWQGGGGFTFYRLGDQVFDEDGRLKPGIRFPTLAAHVWFSETGTPLPQAEGARYEPTPDSSFLGTHDSRGYALLYNGILGDRRPNGGNVLTSSTLALIREAGDGFGGPLTVYGEASRLSEARLKAEGVTFKQTPYDVQAR